MSKKKINIPAKAIAEITGASEELVHKARAGKRKKGKLAKRVLKADELMDTGVNKLLEEVKELVKF